MRAIVTPSAFRVGLHLRANLRNIASLVVYLTHSVVGGLFHLGYLNDMLYSQLYLHVESSSGDRIPVDKVWHEGGVLDRA